MPGLFVTATGTDVGKTYVTAGLIRAWRRAGLAVDALKPVLSGFSADAMMTSDAGVLLSALGRLVTAESIDAISPWRFAAPLSPDMAAAAEGRQIAFDAVVAACRTTLQLEQLTLIEGVGGVMVPLDSHHTILDLMVELALPVVLVSATGLGAISHCLTALEALKSRGLVPAMIALNATEGSAVPLDATQATLGRFCDAVPLAIVPRAAGDSTFDDLAQTLLSRIAS